MGEPPPPLQAEVPTVNPPAAWSGAYGQQLHGCCCCRGSGGVRGVTEGARPTELSASPKKDGAPGCLEETSPEASNM